MKHQVKAEAVLHLDDRFEFDVPFTVLWGIPVSLLSVYVEVTSAGTKLSLHALTTGTKKRKKLSHALRAANFPQVIP